MRVYIAKRVARFRCVAKFGDGLISMGAMADSVGRWVAELGDRVAKMEKGS
jgi:hypothetical protein